MVDDVAELASGPEPPQNVRLLLPDGTVIPLECRYLGLRDGLHVWTTVGTALFSTPGAALLADMLPGRTSIRVLWQERPEG